MPNGLTVARTTYCLLSGCAPTFDSLLVKPRFRTVPCKYLRLRLHDFWIFFLQGLGDQGVELLPGAAQQRAIGGVLHQRVLEQIGRMGRRALAGQQPGLKEPVDRRIQVSVGLARHRGQKRMRKLSPDRRADLRHAP